MPWRATRPDVSRPSHLQVGRYPIGTPCRPDSAHVDDGSELLLVGVDVALQCADQRRDQCGRQVQPADDISRNGVAHAGRLGLAEVDGELVAGVADQRDIRIYAVAGFGWNSDADGPRGLLGNVAAIAHRALSVTTGGGGVRFSCYLGRGVTLSSRAVT